MKITSALPVSYSERALLISESPSLSAQSVTTWRVTLSSGTPWWQEPCLFFYRCILLGHTDKQNYFYLSKKQLLVSLMPSIIFLICFIYFPTFPSLCWLWVLFVLFLILSGGKLGCFRCSCFLRKPVSNFPLRSALLHRFFLKGCAFIFILSWRIFWFPLWFLHW